VTFLFFSCPLLRDPKLFRLVRLVSVASFFSSVLRVLTARFSFSSCSDPVRFGASFFF
jgi:hypothetical protein